MGNSASGSSAAKDKKQLFTFDQVHPPSATQHGLFTSTAEPLLARFLEGFNCTILAYGQTSSGKTFTMANLMAKLRVHNVVELTRAVLDGSPPKASPPLPGREPAAS